MIKSKLTTKDVIKLFVCLLIISGIFVYKTGSFVGLYVALALGGFFLISKKIIDRAQRNERSDEIEKNREKYVACFYSKRLLLVIFSIFSIGVPFLFFHTSLRYKIPAKSLSWDFIFYEIVFIYIFASIILRQEGLVHFGIFRKILIVGTILILCIILTLFYFFSFDHRFIFLAIITLFFSFKLYQRAKKHTK